ncbi:adenosylcobinamide kinase/adenosylcobinamide-phosphate guanylyltransferase [Streptosporangium becharense]|uniref:Adenosylcobinamide kinase n=1 Tax=Streptosporangium becharense TaxID=1816182 RepID=A0A7W9IDH8_9ACTN|nr:bifunctional adenosylcobinamide kinase/adenosylcobinamide-phosphate guanylyltransferase [Streptosporangium becharense]MBB2911914.1 adenosylcobinamide kinase/adenosylcobinamide-phosphate guanylyltransferase [Streptosporangium becharense]MBB5818461.1 adenosylcobinamide kinase/adenosylcobinamide-phosphate guanylyltransferase [Streptosporangium becharense]
MKVLISGTAGAGGWPSPGCECASCGRLDPGHRRPTSVVLSGSVRLPPTGPFPSGHRASSGPDGLTVTTPGGRRVLYAAPLRSPVPQDGPATPQDGLLLPCGGEDGRRALPSPDDRPTGSRGGEDGCGPAPDLVLADVLERPERLGDLRRRGLVGPRTHVIAVDVDHRVPTEAELARRAALWGVRVVPDGTVVDLGEAPPAPAPVPRRTLLLGGSRSGKSAEAELRLAAEPGVLYVATGPSGEGDPEWLRRIEAHRHRRPAHWGTTETTDLAGLLRSATIPLLIDGLGTWVAAVFDECDAWSGENGRDAVAARFDELVDAWRRARVRVVAVSDEVGLGVVPATSGGRLFRDALGRLNQRLAGESEDVALVVAGRLLPLPI